LLEQGHKGNFNADGPREPLDMVTFLEECVTEVGAKNAELKWIEDSEIMRAEIQPWTELPLWIPDSQREFEGFMRFNNKKALASGLVFRPLKNSIVDTIRWRNTDSEPLKAGLSAQREKLLLQHVH